MMIKINQQAYEALKETKDKQIETIEQLRRSLYMANELNRECEAKLDCAARLLRAYVKTVIPGLQEEIKKLKTELQTHLAKAVADMFKIKCLRDERDDLREQVKASLYGLTSRPGRWFRDE